MNLSEAKDLLIYKKLIVILGDYVEKFPATGLEGVFKKLLVGGLKTVPKDNDAQNILKYLLASKESVPAIIQTLLNLRFSDFPVGIKPIYKGENGKYTVAFWCCDGKVYDKVIQLLNLDNYKKCYWCDVKGNKIELLGV